MSDGIGIEEVIGADIILIDTAFHQAHSQNPGVEAKVLAYIGGYRRQVVDSR
jgi:hypothetical protein